MDIDKIKGLIKKYRNIFEHSYVMYNYEDYLETNETKSQPKKALVSYLPSPLLKPYQKRNFSNAGIARSIPRALNEMGYSVDVIDLHNMKFIPNKKYDLFFGHTGSNFKKTYENLYIDTVVICFSPGDYWEFANKQEEKRFEDLRQRRGVTLPYDRHHKDPECEEFSYSVADGIICLGDNSILEPYSKFPLVVTLNNASYYDDHCDKIKKDFEKTRNNFLFFAGGGNVHKGLNLLLEAFSRTDKNLYICTMLDAEFKEEYKTELQRPNIHFMGWVKTRGNKYYEVVDKCSFIIFPSCSEASAGSVVECLNQGLIPIISRETRIDVSDMGIFLEECTVDEITKVVIEVSNKPVSWIKEKSHLARKTALCDYSEEMFIKNMKKNIEKIILKAKNQTSMN